MATDPETIVAAARAWIGTPYIHQASVQGAGCDCLGLLRGVWRALKGAEPEAMPPYSEDWAEATGAETLYTVLARHLTEIPRSELAPGDVALFRMAKRGPAKHCGIMALKQRSDSASATALKQPPGPRDARPEGKLRDSTSAMTLIHARQNACVSEEEFSQLWRKTLAFAFRM